MAAIKQVPTEVAVRVALAAELERAHPCAVPPVTIAYVTAPLPEPPLFAKVGTAVNVFPV